VVYPDDVWYHFCSPDRLELLRALKKHSVFSGALASSYFRGIAVSNSFSGVEQLLLGFDLQRSLKKHSVFCGLLTEAYFQGAAGSNIPLALNIPCDHEGEQVVSSSF